MKKTGPICIVDDDDGHAYLIELNLRQSGVTNELLRFASGQEFLDYLEEDPSGGDAPVMVLLDLNMPGMGGLAVLQVVKDSRIRRTYPIVVLSTSADTDEINACYRAGCNLFLTKPVQYAEFTDLVQRLGALLKVAHFPSGAATTGLAAAG
mgnify:FL=1